LAASSSRIINPSTRILQAAAHPTAQTGRIHATVKAAPDVETSADARWTQNHDQNATGTGALSEYGFEYGSSRWF